MVMACSSQCFCFSSLVFESLFSDSSFPGLCSVFFFCFSPLCYSSSTHSLFPVFFLLFVLPVSLPASPFLSPVLDPWFLFHSPLSSVSGFLMIFLQFPSLCFFSVLSFFFHTLRSVFIVSESLHV